MFRTSIITATIAAAAFVTLGSATPASAAGLDCYAAPAHCEELVVELVPATPVDTPTVITDDPKIPDTPKPTLDIPVGSLIVPLGPSVIDGIKALPHPEPVDPGVPHPDPVKPGDTPDGGGTTTTTTTQAPANDQSNDDSVTTDQPASTNTYTATQNTDDGTFTGYAGEEAISLVDLSAQNGSDTSFNPMMAALFGVLGSLGIMSLTAAAFAAGRRNK
ncbi:MAG: hypothetical protein ACC654_05695 [Acidimicrobiia bacterium]